VVGLQTCVDSQVCSEVESVGGVVGSGVSRRYVVRPCRVDCRGDGDISGRWFAGTVRGRCRFVCLT
jgi:hypothetical protein